LPRAADRSFQGFERWIALIQLDRAVGLECGETARNGAAGALGKNQAQSWNRSSLICLARSRQPEQRKREAVVSRVGGFAGRHCQQSDRSGSAPEKSPGVVPGERMLEIRRNGQRFQGFIRELLGKETRQPIANSPRDSSLALRSKSAADKFQTIRF